MKNYYFPPNCSGPAPECDDAELARQARAEEYRAKEREYLRRYRDKNREKYNQYMREYRRRKRKGL